MSHSFRDGYSYLIYRTQQIAFCRLPINSILQVPSTSCRVAYTPFLSYPTLLSRSTIELTDI